ncbi:hypothetical protein AVEN_95092-1, partial [Araneus ventricosus]
ALSPWGTALSPREIPHNQTCRWPLLWKRDIPLHFGVIERVLFYLSQIEPAKVSLRFENEFLSKRSALTLPNVAVDFIPVSLLSPTRLRAATLSRAFLVSVGYGGSKPDSTGDPPCMWARCTLNHT